VEHHAGPAGHPHGQAHAHAYDGVAAHHGDLFTSQSETQSTGDIDRNGDGDSAATAQPDPSANPWSPLPPGARGPGVRMARRPGPGLPGPGRRARPQ
jgi:hypothetical protein